MSVTLASIRLRDALQIARLRNASDLHMTVGSPPIVRIDGCLESLGGAALGAAELDEIARVFADEEERCRLATCGDLSLAWNDAEFGALRAHFLRCTNGLAIAIRLLKETIPTLESLALPPVVAHLGACERGLLLFAGPTGSGKSTTMAAVVERINATTSRRIVTLEDPIEYRYQNTRSVISQREIGRNTPDLASALHGVLRCDPDVVAIGELRDPNAIRGALTAAETGHLVLATLHTGDAAQTVDRIVGVFSGTLQLQVRAQLAQVLVAVVAQHLVRRGSGPGRRAVVEVLVATPAVRNLIRDAKSHQLDNAMSTGRQHGMQTFEHHMADLLRSGEIDAGDALRLGATA